MNDNNEHKNLSPSFGFKVEGKKFNIKVAQFTQKEKEFLRSEPFINRLRGVKEQSKRRELSDLEYFNDVCHRKRGPTNAVHYILDKDLGVEKEPENRPLESSTTIQSAKEETPRLEEPSATTQERPQTTFNLNEWKSQRDLACPDCSSTPYKDKEGLWHVICTRPKEWKEGKYRWVPKGTKGKIHIEECQRTQSYLIKRQLKTSKSEDFKEITSTENSSEEADFERANLEGEVRRLRQRIKELEPFESALFMQKQIDTERNHITRLLNSPYANESFKCWKGKSTLENCLQFCGSYKDCKDRLSHEPTISVLTYIERQLKNCKYCPTKDQILSEHDCVFECQDRENCQKLKQDTTFLKDRMEKIINLYLDALYPITPSSQRIIKTTQIMVPDSTPIQQPQPEPDWDSLKELPENITWIDPETANLTVEQFEKMYSLNGASENEELDIFDQAERDAEPLRFARGKTLEESTHITETSKALTEAPPLKVPTVEQLSTTLEKPLEFETQTPQDPKNLEDTAPQLIVWQIRCPRDKAQKIQKECLSSCKPMQRNLCSEYQKFPQTDEDLSFKGKE